MRRLVCFLTCFVLTGLCQSIFQAGSPDFNGDQKSDVLGIVPNPNRFVVWTAHSDGSPHFNNGVEWLFERLNYTGYQFGVADVNGDHKADVVAITPNPNRFVVWTARSDGTAFNNGVEWLNERLNYTGYEFFLADVNGDGRADVVAIAPNPNRFVVWTAKTDGSGFNTGVESLYEHLNYAGYQFGIGDVNGDGHADVVAIASNPNRFVVWTAKNDGSSRFNNGVEWLNERLNYGGYQFGIRDVNGDRRADVVAITPNPNRFVVWTAKNDGSGFNNGVEWLDERLNYTGYQFGLADVNGDGRADLVAIAPNPDRFVVWTAKSDGSGFNNGAEWLNEGLNYTGYLFFLDRMTELPVSTSPSPNPPGEHCCTITFPCSTPDGGTTTCSVFSCSEHAPCTSSSLNALGKAMSKAAQASKQKK